MKTSSTFIRLIHVLVVSWFVSLSSNADVAVQRVRVRKEVVVRVTIRNDSTRPLVVPYCGDLNSQKYLCELGVRLEALSGGHWTDATANCNCAVLGGVALDRTVRLEPGRAETFEYAFPAGYFKVKRGQKGRLRVDVWRDADSMKNREPGESLYSAPFAFP